MQTWLVHMREPRRLFHDLGLPGFFAFQLIVGGNVLAALVHPLFMGGLIYSLASSGPMWRAESTAATILAALYGATIVIGYLTSALLGWSELKQPPRATLPARSRAMRNFGAGERRFERQFCPMHDRV